MSLLFDLLAAKTRSAAEAVGRVIRRASESSGRLLRRAEARKRLGESVRATYAAAARDEAEAVHARLSEIADAEASRMAAAIREATGKDAKPAKGAVSLADVRADLAKSNARRAKNAINAVRREVARAKLAASKTGDERADALKDALLGTAKSRAKKRFVDSRGHRWKDGTYNAMRARTMAANAKRRAQIKTLLANGEKLARITDGVQETTCEACHLWRGAIVSLTGRSYNGYPPIEKAIAAGVFHPNCIHFIEPF